MPKTDRPLEVEIPRPGADAPVWSRVGIIGLAGFVIGVAWPHFAGVKVGPNVPADLAARAETSASSATQAPRAPASAGAPAPSGSAAPAGSDAPDAEDAPTPQNQEMVVVGPGKITKCQDKKDKKIDDCEKLLFDPIAVKRLKELAKCPSAMGLSGKISIGFEVNFGKKEIQVSRMKKGTTLPSSTLDGIVQCAGHEFGNASLEDVPHKHRKYTLVYNLTFYPPGKHPEITPTEAGDADPAAGSTTSEAEASGAAIVSWDTALLRKDPKDGEVVARIVRGTKVKIVGKQTDWYKVESGTKVGWVYRGAIGL
jgi:Bacterial SH3 domain